MANCIYNASEIGELNNHETFEREGQSFTSPIPQSCTEEQRGLEAEEIDKGAEGEGVASKIKRA